MRYLLLGLIASLLFFNVCSGTFVRVINAVEESQSMDVWLLRDTLESLQSSQNPNMQQPAVRLFQNLTYSQIPPHFFVWDKPNPQWTFVFNVRSASQQGGSGSQSVQMDDMLTLQQIQSLQSFSTTLSPNTNYTLIVASGTQAAPSAPSGTDSGSQGQSGSLSNFRFLLLVDSAPNQGQSGSQSGSQRPLFVRLVNLVQSQSVSLVTSEAQCQSGTQGGELIPAVSFLQPGQYVQLPADASFQNLRICVNGQASRVNFAPIFQGTSMIYSIFVFNQNQYSKYQLELGLLAQRLQGNIIVLDQSINQNQNQNQGNAAQQQQQQQGQPRMGLQGIAVSEGQEQPQAEGQLPEQQGQWIAFIADDEPNTSRNVRIRAIHAGQQLPPVNILLDGQLVQSNVNFSTVTLYRPTIRGVHNITIVPSTPVSQQDLQALNLNIQFPYSVLVFLAWDSYYTLAILPTGVNIVVNNQPTGQSGAQGQGMMDLAQIFRSDVGNGFLGPLHRIFLDNIPMNQLSEEAAYVQVIHLAVNLGLVNVTLGQQSFVVLPLEDTPYRPVQTGAGSTIRIEALNQGSQGTQSGTQSQQPQQGLPATINQSLQANTLYTIFILEQQGSALIIVQRDRQVRVLCSVLNIEEAGQGGQSGQQGGQSGSQQGAQGGQQ